MGVPLSQQITLGKYLLKQKVARKERFPVLVEIEPLFACNLACEGCGKIQHPPEILKKRMTVDEVVNAVEECGAPMVSIAGGEPLVHPDIGQMCEALLERQKIIFLCTNALLLKKKMHLFEPSDRFSWTVHIDGLKERHDKVVCRPGVFDEAIDAIKEAQDRGFTVRTNTTFFRGDTVEQIRATLDYLNDEVKVDGMMISPGFAYEKAPAADQFLSVPATRKLFQKIFSGGRREKWRLNHSPLFLDFLEGKAELECTPWGIPSYSIFGWQKPCYLMSDGYVDTYAELVAETEWDNYGRGRDPRCSNCMAHCGYEPSAVRRTTSSLREAFRAFSAQ